MNSEPSIFREELAQLIARASELDGQGEDRVELSEARAIALELGISETSWIVALREQAGSDVPVPQPVNSRRAHWRSALVAAAGVVGGAMVGAASSALIG